MRFANALTSRLRLCLESARGSASLEFLTAGLLLLVPLVYAAIIFGALQAASLAAEGAARHSARIWVQQPDLASADRLAAETVALAVEDFRLQSGATDWRRECTNCLAPGSRVRILVSVQVRLPLVPSLFGLDRATAITVVGEARQTVSTFEGAAP